MSNSNPNLNARYAVTNDYALQDINDMSFRQGFKTRKEEVDINNKNEKFDFDAFFDEIEEPFKVKDTVILIVDDTIEEHIDFGKKPSSPVIILPIHIIDDEAIGGDNSFEDVIDSANSAEEII